MDKLISDSDQSDISNRVNEMMRALLIDDWKLEPCYLHQNFSERRHQNAKRQTNTLLDVIIVPPCAWLTSMIYVCFVLNHSYSATIKNITMTAATGSTCDISSLLRFHF